MRPAGPRAAPGARADVRSPLVAVLTPVYNGAEYLAECVESVLAQDHPNWRYVIVDNASTDGTLEIARGYAGRDPRIRVESFPELVSVTQNFNRALGLADPESDYVKFVCADDWLYPECLRRMVELAERAPSVTVVGGFRLDDTRVNLDGIPVEEEVVDGRRLCRGLLVGGAPFVFGSPTSSMLRAAATQGRRPFFDEDFLHADDNEACYFLLQEGDFGFVHQVLTYSRRPTSALLPRFARMGLRAPEQLRMLLRYGPVYLTPAEYERKLAVLVGRYTRDLALRAPRVRDPVFRGHQAKSLGFVRGQIGAAQMARGLARGLAHQARKHFGRRTRPLRRGDPRAP